MTPLKLTLFALFWFTAVYLFNSSISRGFKKVEPKLAVLYVSSLAMLGVFGEVLVGNIYKALFDKPLWLYHVLPIHDGFTSYYAPIIWGILGFHLYLLHGTLRTKNKVSGNTLALMFAGETLIIELLGNSSFKFVFNDYIFYYLPPDLWHYTSVQTLPFYVAAGFVLTRVMTHMRVDPIFFSCMASALACVLVFFV